MKNETREQAHNLFFQTNMTKTEIANVLQISRQTLYTWCKQGAWDNLKQTSRYMPSLIAEKCYFIMNDLADHLLSVKRMHNPITIKEVETMHKLTLTIGKLKTRATMNENMETFTSLLATIQSTKPELAAQVVPFVEQYLASQLPPSPREFPLEDFNSFGRIENGVSMVQEEINSREAELDREAERIYTGEDIRFKQEQEEAIREIEVGAARYDEAMKNQEQNATPAVAAAKVGHGESLPNRTAQESSMNNQGESSLSNRIAHSAAA